MKQGPHRWLGIRDTPQRINSSPLKNDWKSTFLLEPGPFSKGEVLNFTSVKNDFDLDIPTEGCAKFDAGIGLGFFHA